MKNRFANVAILALLTQFVPMMAFAEEVHGATGANEKGVGLLAAAIAIGLAALGGTLAQGRAVTANLEAIGRNPGATGNLFVPMLLGLAFIESLVVISFVIAFTIAGKF